MQRQKILALASALIVAALVKTGQVLPWRPDAPTPSPFVESSPESELEPLTSAFLCEFSERTVSSVSTQACQGPGLSIQVRYSAGSSSVDPVKVYVRNDPKGWSLLGQASPTEPMAWLRPTYPCEIIAQGGLCFGQAAVDVVPEAVQAAMPSVVLELNPTGSITGYLGIDSDSRTGEPRSAEVYYLNNACAQIPLNRKSLQAMPAVMGGVLALGAGESCFDLCGLDPTGSYRLWATAVSKATTTRATLSKAGSRDVELTLHDLLGFRASMTYLGQGVGLSCEHPGHHGYAMRLPRDSAVLSASFPPLRWAAWEEGLSTNLRKAATSLAVIVGVGDSSGPPPTVTLSGGFGGIHLTSVSIELSPIAADGSLPLVQVEMPNPPQATGSVNVLFEAAWGALSEEEPSRRLGTLELYPLDGSPSAPRVALTVADFPFTAIDCIPVGLYRALFTAADSGMTNDPEGLPLLNVQAGLASQLSLHMPAWGSVEVHRYDANGIEDQRSIQVLLLDSNSVDSLPDSVTDAPQVVSGTTLNVPVGVERVHFVPTGVYCIDPSNLAEPRIENVTPIEVVAAGLVSIESRPRQ